MENNQKQRAQQFALIGAGGFIAPRHFRAIRDTGNILLAALDKHDSVGILDQFFPQASFFTEFERFDRHLDNVRRNGIALDYLSVCSPNYLHDAHIRFGLRTGADVICEKPLVLNDWNLDALREMEIKTGKHIYNILQLRLHPVIARLKQQEALYPAPHKKEIELTYITSRGSWYHASWKGDHSKSGGIATNIGIHFFDMLLWIYGAVQGLRVDVRTHDRAAGVLYLDRAVVRWFLSIDADTLPEAAISEGKTYYRQMLVEEKAVDFSDGFTDLHTLSYQEILQGRGFGLEEAAPSLEVVQQIRQASVAGPLPDSHPLAHRPLKPHPFGW